MATKPKELQRKKLLHWEDLQKQISEKKMTELDAVLTYLKNRNDKTGSHCGTLDYRPLLILAQKIKALEKLSSQKRSE